MKKRKLDSTLSPSLPPKQIKIDYSLNPLLGILQPLIDSEKLFINGKKPISYNKINDNEVYQKFHNHPSELSQTEKELSKFIPKQLASLDNKEDKDIYGRLDYLDLRKIPSKDKDNTRMDFYNAETGRKKDKQTITISPYNTVDNPILTLIHEGTHALDDLYMRTYQNEAINALAKMEDKKIKPIEDSSWYAQAQDILNSDNFKKYYPYNSETGKQNIEKGFSNLAKDYSSDEYKPDEINSFKQAQTAIKNLNSTDRAPDSKHFFASLSEFPAHAVENINSPWAINNDNWQTQNNGRKFLKNVTKGVYNNFYKLEPNFNVEYPTANQSFIDRISELRNRTKYSDASKYLDYLRTKHNYTPNMYLPTNYQQPSSTQTTPPISYQSTTTQTTPSTPPLSNPIKYI